MTAAIPASGASLDGRLTLIAKHLLPGENPRPIAVDPLPENAILNLGVKNANR